MWKKNEMVANGNDPVETEFNRISRKLGYRLRLVDATFPTAVSVGGEFSFAANLHNDGYAGPIKARPLFLVFDNGTDRYNIELSKVDVRTWLSGAIVLKKQNIDLPKNMVAGKYKVALWLSDASTNLRATPSYSIRFANNNMWDAANGYNLLTDSFVVK